MDSNSQPPARAAHATESPANPSSPRPWQVQRKRRRLVWRPPVQQTVAVATPAAATNGAPTDQGRRAAVPRPPTTADLSPPQALRTPAPAALVPANPLPTRFAQVDNQVTLPPHRRTDDGGHHRPLKLPVSRPPPHCLTDGGQHRPLKLPVSRPPPHCRTDSGQHRPLKLPVSRPPPPPLPLPQSSSMGPCVLNMQASPPSPDSA